MIHCKAGSTCHQLIFMFEWVASGGRVGDNSRYTDGGVQGKVGQNSTFIRGFSIGDMASGDTKDEVGRVILEIGGSGIVGKAALD